jgi:hypothetical protein
MKNYEINGWNWNWEPVPYFVNVLLTELTADVYLELTMLVSCGCSVMRNLMSLYSISAGAGRMILPVILQI